MKIKLNLQDRGTFEFEHEPISSERFRKIINIIYYALYVIAQLLALRFVGGVAMFGLMIPFICWITIMYKEI